MVGSEVTNGGYSGVQAFFRSHTGHIERNGDARGNHGREGMHLRLTNACTAPCALEAEEFSTDETIAWSAHCAGGLPHVAKPVMGIAASTTSTLSAREDLATHFPPEKNSPDSSWSRHDLSSILGRCGITCVP